MKNILFCFVLFISFMHSSYSKVEIIRQKEFGDDYQQAIYYIGVNLKNEPKMKHIRIFNGNEKILDTLDSSLKKIKIKNGNRYLQKAKFLDFNSKLRLFIDDKEFVIAASHSNFDVPLINIGSNFLIDHSFSVNGEALKNQNNFLHAWVSDWENSHEYWYDYSKNPFSKLNPKKANAKEARFEQLPKDSELYLGVRLDVNAKDEKDYAVKDIYYSFKKFILK